MRERERERERERKEMVKGGVYRIQSMMPKPQSFTANVKKFKIL